MCLLWYRENRFSWILDIVNDYFTVKIVTYIFCESIVLCKYRKVAFPEDLAFVLKPTP